uniref:MFS domain-containing protein n=1 Tax=Macrostomum lignano TaxID=282301 RepID=A0A1I8FJE1_9PLAT
GMLLAQLSPARKKQAALQRLWSHARRMIGCPKVPELGGTAPAATGTDRKDEHLECPHNFIHSTHELDVKADPTMASIVSLGNHRAHDAELILQKHSCIALTNQQTLCFQETSINTTYTERNGVEPAPTFLTLIWSVIISAFVGAGALGSFSSGVFALRKFGRRRGLFINHLLAFASAAAEMAAYYCKVYELLIVGRAIIGFNSGISQGLVSLYIAEVSPKQVRGAFLSFHQIGIVIGILLGQVPQPGVRAGRVNTWPFLCGFSVMPCLLSCCLLPLCPESPRYLLSVRKDEAAAKAALLRLTRSKHAAKELLNEIREEEKVVRQPARPVRELPVPGPVHAAGAAAQPHDERPAEREPACGAASTPSSRTRTPSFYNAGVDPEAIQYAIIGTGVIKRCRHFHQPGADRKSRPQEASTDPELDPGRQPAGADGLHQPAVQLRLAELLHHPASCWPTLSALRPLGLWPPLTLDDYLRDVREQQGAASGDGRHHRLCTLTSACFVLMLTSSSWRKFISCCLPASLPGDHLPMFYLHRVSAHPQRQRGCGRHQGWLALAACNGSEPVPSPRAPRSRGMRPESAASSGTYIKRATPGGGPAAAGGGAPPPLRKGGLYDAMTTLEA